MRWLLGLACAGAMAGALAAYSPAHAAPVAACNVLQLQVAGPGGPTTAYRVTLPGNASTRLGTLPYRIDAIGYSQAQELVYGIGPGPRVVVIDEYGRIRDLGVIRGGGQSRLPGAAEAGAITGSRWYLRSGAKLYTVNIDPASERYLRVVGVRELRPVRFANFADFGVDPRTGRLRGVAVSSRGDVIAMSVDPASGAIRPEPAVQLPAALSFESVVVGRDGTFYAAAREPGGRGGWYRVSPVGSVERVGEAPGGARADAAGCLPALRALPRPPAGNAPLPPIPPPRLVPPEEPDSPSPREPSPREPSAPPPAGPRPETVHQQEKQLAEEEQQNRTAQKRGWGLATMLLVLGAGAAAHRR